MTTAAPAPPPPSPSPSEVRDTADDLEAVASTPALRSALDFLGATVATAFDGADRKAIAHQRSFRVITMWATVCGILSILFSIGNLVATVLAAGTVADAFFFAQVVALVATAAAVLRGLFAYRHENWLLERCRAEQLRSAKFVHLLDPLIWSPDPVDRQAWEARVQAEVERVRAMRYEDILAIAGQSEVAGIATTPEATPPEPAALDALATYYHRKRLAPQREYFLRVSLQRARVGARALPLFFFGAVFLEILQAVLTLAARAGGASRLETMGNLLSGAAIAIPAVWAGIRTQQGAFEGARNATRSRARHASLTQLADRLLAARGRPADQLRLMHLSEFVLLVEQREWLRLLREAEWYG